MVWANYDAWEKAECHTQGSDILSYFDPGTCYGALPYGHQTSIQDLKVFLLCNAYILNKHDPETS